jgi:hypothetical protein
METQTRSPLAQTHHQPKEEISIWHKTGNFYFGLTGAIPCHAWNGKTGTCVTVFDQDISDDSTDTIPAPRPFVSASIDL